MLRVLFGFEGRIGRRNYWLAIILQVVIVTVVALVFGSVLVGVIMGSVAAADGMGLDAQMMMGPDGEPSPDAVAAVVAAIGIPYLIFLFFIFGFSIYMSLAAQIKRLHDMNMSGWLTLLNFVPIPISAMLMSMDPANAPIVLFLNLIPLGLGIACAFFPGTVGANQYGEDRLSIFDIAARTDETWADRAQAHRDSLRETAEETREVAAQAPRPKRGPTRSGPVTTRKGFGKRGMA